MHLVYGLTFNLAVLLSPPNTFADAGTTPPPGFPSPVLGTGPPNFSPPPGVTFPCIPPGTAPSISLIDPPNGGINVRRSLSRIIIRVESPPDVSGTVSITSGKRTVHVNVSQDATLAASPTAEALIVMSAPVHSLTPATTYHVTILGWQYSTSPCRKRYSADLGNFTTSP